MMSVKDAIREIEIAEGLTLQQRADRMTKVFQDAGSDLRVVVAAGRVPRLRFVVASRRERGAPSYTPVSG